MQSVSASVLVVEDDALIAMGAAETLEAAGFTVVGPVAGEADAEVLVAAEKPNLALIDIRLQKGGDGQALARRLWERHRTPSLYVTGNSDHAVPGPWSCGCLTKPYVDLDLLAAVGIALALLADQQPNGPIPKGLRLWGFAHR